MSVQFDRGWYRNQAEIDVPHHVLACLHVASALLLVGRSLGRKARAIAIGVNSALAQSFQSVFRGRRGIGRLDARRERVRRDRVLRARAVNVSSASVCVCLGGSALRVRDSRGHAGRARLWLRDDDDFVRRGSVRGWPGEGRVRGGVAVRVRERAVRAVVVAHPRRARLDGRGGRGQRTRGVLVLEGEGRLLQLEGIVVDEDALLVWAEGVVRDGGVASEEIDVRPRGFVRDGRLDGVVQLRLGLAALTHRRGHGGSVLARVPAARLRRDDGLVERPIALYASRIASFYQLRQFRL